MLLIICFAVAVAILLFIGFKIRSLEFEFAGFIMGALFFIVLLYLPFARMESRSFVNKYRATEQTLLTQRGQSNSIENAALSLKIIEINQELRGNQYWARSKWVNWFYVSEILELTPLQ